MTQENANQTENSRANEPNQKTVVVARRRDFQQGIALSGLRDSRPA